MDSEDPEGDQDAEIAPKQALSCNQTTKNVVLPELASYDSSGEKTHVRDVAVQGSTTLVAGVDSRPPFLLAQQMEGSADQGLMMPFFGQERQEQHTDAYSENCELKKRVKTLEGENEKLREKFRDLQLREREVEVKEKEVEIEVRRRESDLDLRERELQLEERRLKLEKDKHAFEEQQRRDRHLEKEQGLQEKEQELQVKDKELQVKDQELQVKERELRAYSLELQTKRDQHQLEVEKFELKQREQREHNLSHELEAVMEENKQLKKEAKRLEKENNELKSKVSLLESEVDFLINTPDDIQLNGDSLLPSEDANGDVPHVEELEGISNMIALSKVVGSCGKQCIVCGKEENRCTVCGCPRAEHSTDKTKEDHIFDKQALRDSHAYSDKMLQRVCGNKNEEVIWDATKGPKVASRKPSTCCWSLLCKQCEQSTSAIEGNICKRHDDRYYQDKLDGVIHPEDVRVFCVFTYRAMPVNTNIFHFLQFDASEREHKATGRVLKFLHQAFTSQDTDTSQCGDCIESCEKGMLYLYHHFTDEHKIEFPFLCKVDLTSTAVGLGHEWLVYGQMPPYYWAFPLNSDKAGLLQLHFRQIIQCINSQLELECGQYYAQCPEAQQRRSTTKLVVGYLRKLNKRYLSVKMH